MRRSRSLISLPVVSLDEGKEIGHVRALVVDPARAEVAALLVQQGGFFGEQKVIPYPRVVSAGNNALTVQKASSAEKLTSLPQIVSLIKENVQLRGARVITEGGKALGVVEEFFVDPATGKIAAFEISGKFSDRLLKSLAVLPAEEVRTVGRDVLVVHNGAEASLNPGEGLLTGGIKNLKENTQRLLQRAWPQRPKPEAATPEVTPETPEQEAVPPQATAVPPPAEEPPAGESKPT